jgi:hypothetical protein
MGFFYNTRLKLLANLSDLLGLWYTPKIYLDLNTPLRLISTLVPPLANTELLKAELKLSDFTTDVTRPRTI